MSSPIFAMKLGVGLSSLTAGRYHPMLYASIDPGSFSFTASSLGFNQRYGYYAGYNGAVIYNMPLKRFEAGLGWGFTYVQAGYRDSVDDQLEKDSTWSTGPAIKTFWYPLSFLFVGMQGTFGINLPTLFGLAVQDHVAFIIGGNF